MTEAEARIILDRIGVLFPDWQAWTSKLTTNATVVGWMAALMTVEIEHVRTVLSDWQFGRRKCPETYERERLVYMAVEIARQIQAKEAEKELHRDELRTYHEHAAEAERRRKAYKPVRVAGLGQAGIDFSRAVEEVCSETGRPRSQWTAEDRQVYDRKAKEILRRFDAASEEL